MSGARARSRATGALRRAGLARRVGRGHVERVRFVERAQLRRRGRELDLHAQRAQRLRRRGRGGRRQRQVRARALERFREQSALVGRRAGRVDSLVGWEWRAGRSDNEAKVARDGDDARARAAVRAVLARIVHRLALGAFPAQTRGQRPELELGWRHDARAGRVVVARAAAKRRRRGGAHATLARYAEAELVLGFIETALAAACELPNYDHDRDYSERARAASSADGGGHHCGYQQFQPD